MNTNLNLDLFDSALPLAPRLTTWTPEQWVVDRSWQALVSDFFAQHQGQLLENAITARLQKGAVIYPPEPLRALALTPLAQVKVVILGQDPYHGPGQAQGLAFSVATGCKIPPSLRNIFKEVARDAALREPLFRQPPDPTRRLQPRIAPTDGSLQRWAEQGVLLLNTCLTVENGRPASHAKWGWEVLTDRIIQAIWALEQPVVFMLWGAYAQTKQALMAARAAQAGAQQLHLVLTANHPSPLSALREPQPFIGCGHFSKANQHLQAHGLMPIDW